MNGVASELDAKILSTSLHHLDIETGTCNSVAIPVDKADLEAYLSALLLEIHGRPQNRLYTLVSPTTEFATSLNAFFGSKDLIAAPETQTLASRLLRIEVDTEERYGHLDKSGKGLVNKGSFLQFLYQDGGSLSYLGVKIEHQRFIDETDLKRKIGLGESNKIYKACKVSMDAEGKMGQVFVFDTHSRPSTYWWKEVLELKQLRSDALNTEMAVKSVVKTLGKVKSVSPVDYSILRNATIAAFKQNETLSFDDFVTKTFASYVPVSAALTDLLPSIVTNLRSLPEKRNFDGQFTLVPSAVPFRRQTIKVSEQISVAYDEDIPDLPDKIWYSKTPAGQSVLVLDAPNGAGGFIEKPWNLK
ncbi:hypothetical protein [Pseudomonas sp. RIT288]|uniref:hypothetical protein n=1 Tax=Pseudomonas sp. RIT288 TaxID=1470589 RepID=UPI000450FBCA|nr:hypothetical protein [Pseudomonas sp. RIT288]EZP31902.1 37-kD nucleoid-associated bacterial protein [Pseudomonas sp. RIT288]